ncbi:MAG: low molecular weight protein-tyrosine-phosphatase [Pseudomonadota bacterium]|nr:low molecular weight protein-tyrosine-phosphatase [Pseudomonadota bacterium]
MRKVLFVCMGNICRSPAAEGVFRGLVTRHGLSERIYIESAGTHRYHVGAPPDPRMVEAALAREIDLREIRARQVTAEDFFRFDYILAMDQANLSGLSAIRPGAFSGHLGLFLDFASDKARRDVPDPYYGSERGFQLVIDLVTEASEGLLAEIRKQL